MVDSSNKHKKQLAQDKLARIPVKIKQTTAPIKKPDWIKIKLSHIDKVTKLKNSLRENKLVTVCEEASCPNIYECFAKGTATFMIMGDICTRRCSFCDVAHGKPKPLDKNEPQNLGKMIANLDLKYVVITSVDRDDLLDGGAQHFADCIYHVRKYSPHIKIEILVPDFRGKKRIQQALEILSQTQPEVFNHNIETVPRLYKQARPGSDYAWSLNLLKQYKAKNPNILSKSGLMVGLGETMDEIKAVLADLRKHNVDMVTIGQYLQPSRYHIPVVDYYSPQQFDELAAVAKKLGFTHVASGPLVRSSYHADKQAAGEKVG